MPRTSRVLLRVLAMALLAGAAQAAEPPAVEPREQEAEVEQQGVVSSRSAVPEAPTLRLDPNYSRLMFGPTGRPLKKGDGYFSDYELFFPGLSYGLTDNFTLSGGLSTIPGIGLGQQLFYISPKLGTEWSDRGAVSVGALYATAADDGDRLSLGIGYVVGTIGGRDRSLTAGLGLASADFYGDGAETQPILMLGGHAALGQSVALVTESWLFLGNDFRLSDQPVGVAVRFFGDRLSADVGVVVSRELLEEGFPIPWLSVSYHFGKSWPKAGHGARLPLPGRP